MQVAFELLMINFAKVKPMSTIETSSPPPAKKTKKVANAFTGIIFGVFEDDGPIARYSINKLPKKLVNKLVIHGISAVHCGDDMLGGLFGPLPLFGKPNQRYLIYSFTVKASNTKDSRIAEHGRTCSIFLLLKDEQQRFILNNHKTIEKYILKFRKNHWTKELDITKDSVLILLNKLNDLVKIVNIRAFSFGEAGFMEFADPHTILDDGILTIIDLKLHKAHIYLSKDRFDSKIRINALEKLEELNLREFGTKLKIIKVRDYVKFKKIIDKHFINLVK